MTAASDLQSNLTAIGLPADAIAWLMDLWNVSQVLDDAYDGDRAEKDEVIRAVRAIFWDMPLNPFYRHFQTALQPVLLQAALQWEAASKVEDAGEADEKSYGWRAQYYGIVLMACHLCGIEAGPDCLRLYGETFKDYISEWRQV